jgi:hypothetical protein
MPDETRQIPLAALKFAADLEMGDNGEGAKTVPIKLKARGAQAVDHWFFGRIVHDLAGMSLSKPRLAIDYCHREDEVMGFANKFDTEGGLVASGALTPFQEKDRASEVIFKSQQGVPYEASIFFDPAELVLEEVPQGMSVPVNGLTFAGPGVVARRWTLRGLAVCPYGQDKNTAVEFSAGQQPKEVGEFRLRRLHFRSCRLMHRVVRSISDPGLLVDHRQPPAGVIGAREMIEPRHRTIVDVECEAIFGQPAKCEADGRPDRAAMRDDDDVPARLLSVDALDGGAGAVIEVHETLAAGRGFVDGSKPVAADRQAGVKCRAIHALQLAKMLFGERVHVRHV